MWAETLDVFFNSRLKTRDTIEAVLLTRSHCDATDGLTVFCVRTLSYISD